jgi:hypothetical protein
MAGKRGSKPGERRGGRAPGTPNKATIRQKGTLEELARAYTEQALATLAQICTAGESEAARVAAANALLDRGYGKPSQSVEHSGKDGEEIKMNVTMREVARRALFAAEAAERQPEEPVH